MIAGIYILKALEHLHFNGCRSLTKTPEGLRELTCLRKLYMWDFKALEEFPSGI